MLAHFSISQVGESHKSDSRICQDCSASIDLYSEFFAREFVVAAIADGVGSCDFSDRGSHTAVDAFVEYMQHHLSRSIDDDTTDSDEYLLRLVRGAFDWALKRIEERADEEELPFLLFDTTLTGVIYDGKSAWIGHAGDDGMVAMRNDGTYSMVTHRHEGNEASSVRPLRFQDTWEFLQIVDVASFVLMTDGLLDSCVGSEYYGNRVDLSFLRTLLYTPLPDEESKGLLHEAWNAYLAGDSDGSGWTELTQTLDDSKNNRLPHFLRLGTREKDAVVASLAGEGAPLRFRDFVKDDLSLVAVSNSDAVALLPAYSFDKVAFDEETEYIRQETENVLAQQPNPPTVLLPEASLDCGGRETPAHEDDPVVDVVEVAHLPRLKVSADGSSSDDSSYRRTTNVNERSVSTSEDDPKTDSSRMRQGVDWRVGLGIVFLAVAAMILVMLYLRAYLYDDTLASEPQELSHSNPIQFHSGSDVASREEVDVSGDYMTGLFAETPANSRQD